MTSKKRSAKRPTSRAEFVRSQPRDMPADQVVAKAAAVGLKLTKDNVYRTRMLDRRAKRAKNSPVQRSRKPRPLGQHIEHVRALRTVILHVGVDRAKEMMDQVVRDLMVMA